MQVGLRIIKDDKSELNAIVAIDGFRFRGLRRIILPHAGVLEEWPQVGLLHEGALPRSALMVAMTRLGYVESKCELNSCAIMEYDCTFHRDTVAA